MPNIVFNRLKYHLAEGDLDWPANTVRAMLVLRDTWTPNADDDYVQTILTAGADELSGGGYARQTLAGKTNSLDDTNDRATLDGDVIDFGALSSAQTFNSLVVYRFVTNDADSWLIAHWDLGTTYTADGSYYMFTPNTDGFLEIV